MLRETQREERAVHGIFDDFIFTDGVQQPTPELKQAAHPQSITITSKTSSDKTPIEYDGYHNFADDPQKEIFAGYRSDDGTDITHDVLLWMTQKLHQTRRLVVGSDPTRWENRNLAGQTPDQNIQGIPAGYTYLLQLAVHDLVHTSVPITPTPAGTRTVRNMRQIGLDLETLYGGGPNVCPHAFASPEPNKRFRWKLKLGATKRFNEKPGSASGPVRAIVRDQRPDRTTNEKHRYVSDVMIADARNEDTVMLAQLTALFHAFHNIVVDRMNSKLADASGIIIGAHGENVSDVGFCARAVTAYVFRQILKWDLLARLLDETVYEAYRDTRDFIDTPPRAGSLPLEFTHAVSRIGHQMVRPNYAFNDQAHKPGEVTSFPLHKIFKFRSLSNEQEGEFPLRPSWLVDWTLFFDCHRDRTNHENFNWAAKPGLHAATDLFHNKHFPSPYKEDANTDIAGLIFRDLDRSAKAGLWSLSGLLAKIEGNASAHLELIKRKHRNIFDQDFRKTLVKDALNALGTDHKEEHYIDVLSDNPPLALFTMIETLQRDAAGNVAEHGSRLGPIASIIFAEVFFRAINRNDPKYALDSQNLTDSTRNRSIEWERIVRRWSETIFDGIPENRWDMLQLLRVVADENPNALGIHTEALDEPLSENHPCQYIRDQIHAT